MASAACRLGFLSSTTIATSTSPPPSPHRATCFCPSSLPCSTNFLPPRPSCLKISPNSSSSSSRRSRSRLLVRAGRNSIDAPDRILAAGGYLLPLLDGIQYGRYFFIQFPAAQVVFQPLYPVIRVYSSTPFASIVVFFGLYLLVVRNPSVSRYVRFNTMQAVILDVLLILPNLVEGTFHPNGGIGFELLVIFYNTVFLFLATCFVFGTVSCILGRTPRLPLVADAAEAQFDSTVGEAFENMLRHKASKDVWNVKAHLA